MKEGQPKSFYFRSIATGVMLFLTLTRPTPAFTDPTLADSTLEARARAVSRQLRCMVCQNQSIEESNTELASDMRRLVREQVMSGAADDDIIRFLTDRYGDFVTLMPPFRPSTWLLWLAPAFFLFIAVFTVRHSLLQVDKDTPLSDEERRRVYLLMREESRHE